MNQLRIAGCTPGALEQAGQDIIDRSLLWEVKNDNLWIKDKDKLIGIGGNIKQDKLTAGDNIEIIEEGENVLGGDRKDTIRLKDNVEVHSCTISPGTEEDPILPWKGTIFLGELTDGNQVYLITKATQVKDEDQALFGGQILIKMTTKEGKDIYAQYALTITSTGSWSLWGGNNAGANVRVCKAKYKDEWYYGIKIPSGDFQNVKDVEVYSYDTTAKNLSERTYLQVDEDGDFHLGFTGHGSGGLKLEYERSLGPISASRPNTDVGIYSVKVKDLLQNELGLRTADWADMTDPSKANPEDFWAQWAANDEKIKYTIATERAIQPVWTILNTSNSIYLRKDAYGIPNQSSIAGSNAAKTASYRLIVRRPYACPTRSYNHNHPNGYMTDWEGNKSTWGSLGNATQWGVYNTAHTVNGVYFEVAFRCDGVAVIDADDPEEHNLSGYNYWYSMAMSDFQEMLGFTFEGEWAEYTRAGYRLCFRIYTRHQSDNEHSTRITRIQIRNTNTNYNHGQGGVNGTIVEDFKVSYPDAPFQWDANSGDLINLLGGIAGTTPVYAQLPPSTNAIADAMPIGIFNDRIANPNAGQRAVKLCITDVEYPSNPIGNNPFTKFDEIFLSNNRTQVEAFSTNKIPVFKEWSDTNVPILVYEGEGANSWTFFGDFLASYHPVNGFKIEQQYFIDNLNLDKTEIWYNGWYDLPDPLVPPQPPTSELEFQVLARESQDEDSFSEVFFSSEPIPIIVNRIDGLQDLGEDAPPYKWVISERVLSLADLQTLAAHIKNSDKQIYLDLSQCTVANNAREWEGIFEGCVSLRGLVIPQGVTHIGNGCFIWCTYMRELDLSPSTSSLKEIGGGSGWATSMGLLTSTRIRTVIVPKNVTHFSNYLVYSSNVENFITLYGAEFGPTVDDLLFKWGDEGWTSEWTWFGIKAGNGKTDELPDGFHLFFDIDFWESAGFVHGRTTSGSVYPGNDRWPQTVKNSIVTYNMAWGQKEWQEFNNKYHWGEDLINKVRRLKNPNVSDLEIIDYSYMQ